MSEDTAVQPEEGQASKETGLLDSVETNDESQQAPSEEATEVEHRASDSIPEDEAVDRPDWWPENFWKKDSSEPDLEGIAKSWMDLRKQISQGKHKAPPEGKYDLSAFGDDAESKPMVPVFQKWAAENGVSQTAFDALASELTGMANEMISSQQQFDPASEKKALGPNADAVINGMVNWARGLVNKGIWSSEDFDEFKVMGGTAKGLKALMKLRETYEGSKIPVESVPIEGMPTDQELQQMVGDARYQTDAAYRQKVEKLFNARYN
jgi:hypothetical protein